MRQFGNKTKEETLYDKAGRPTGDRYRYLSDNDKNDGNRYFYLDEGSYKTTDTRYRGERTQIIIKGTMAAQSSSDYGAEYFTTDLLGSIASVTNTHGNLNTTYTYDVFGSLIQGELAGTTDFGYLGKQHDQTAKLYNYGYRDYKPIDARFITIDPIRDGHNWFSYCNGDPVNFVDVWGLEQTEEQKRLQKAISDRLYYDLDLQEYVKNNTRIEITRSIKDTEDSKEYYQTKASFYIGNQKINEVPIQSTADNKNLGKNDGTLPVGTYEGILQSTSGSYLFAIKIKNPDFFIHPDRITNLNKQKERIADGKTNGPFSQPFSRGCPIMMIEDFDETIKILHDLNFKSNGKDKIRVDIQKEKTENTENDQKNK